MPDLSPFVIAGLCTGAVYVLAGVGLVVLYRASGRFEFGPRRARRLGRAAGMADRADRRPGMDRLDCRRSQLDGACLFYGRVIAPRLAHSDPIIRAVATLGFALVVLGFCEFFWGEWPRSLRLPTDGIGLLRLRRSRHRHAGDCVRPGRGRDDWHDRVPQPQPARSVDAGARQRSRDQRARRRAGASGRRLGVGDFRRAVRRERHFPRQYVASCRRSR